MITISDRWQKAFPGAHMGILAMGDVANPQSHAGLEPRKAELETDLRTLFRDPAELKSLEPLTHYQAYFKRFKKTYHVFQQLESVVFKGKSVPKVAALVEAMFMAELRNMLLTAGHDLDLVEAPIVVDVSRGDEQYTRINGQEQVLKPGDMMTTDGKGVISSVIYGPDQRTRMRATTTRVLFVVYAVPGVGERAVEQHLQGIEENVQVIAPGAKTELLRVYGTTE